MDPGAGIITAIDTLEADLIILVGVAYLLYDKYKSKQK